MEAKLTQHCANCGAIHGSDMRFCTECGTPLEALISARKKPHAEQAAEISHASFKKNNPQEYPKSYHHQIQNVSPYDQGPLCGTCHQVGLSNTTFCVHCGASYSQASEFQETIRSTLTEEQAEAGLPFQAHLIMTDKRGTDTQTFPLNRRQIDLGRKEGEIILPDDPYVSPRHARFLLKGNSFAVQDLASVNGIYRRIHRPWQLHNGDFMMIGQQVLRLNMLPEAEHHFAPASINGVNVFGSPLGICNARLARYTVEGIERDVHYLKQGSTTIGREGSDIVFHDDPYLSRQHAMIINQQGQVVLEDMNSSNGTFTRIRNELVLNHGDQLRIGKHLFRFEIKSSK